MRPLPWFKLALEPKEWDQAGRSNALVRVLGE